MRNEVEYQMWVKQPVYGVMAQVELDAAQFDITAEELNRAVLSWVMERIQAGEVPEWFLKDMSTDEEI